MAVVAIVAACRRMPSGVIAQEDMAQLMADLYIAQSVVEMNRSSFPSDSQRRVLKQSVLAKHRVTSQDFDSSLMWYGKNYDKYVKVYERTVEILEDKNNNAGSELLTANASFFGDSVDVWTGSRYAQFGPWLPSEYLWFDINADENSRSGDVYTWRLKLHDDHVRSVRWVMMAQYADSTIDYFNNATSRFGWNDITFFTDSTRSLVHLRGYLEPILDRDTDPAKVRKIWIDSISLVRKRLASEMYGIERHRVHQIKDF